MKDPTRPKDLQSLIGKITALSRFIDRSTDRCKLLFDILRVNKSLSELKNAKMLFEELKARLPQLTLLFKPNAIEKLSIDLAISEHSLSVILIIEEDGIQYPVYYLSKALYDIRLRYSLMEKLFYALVISTIKLRPYIVEYPIEVLNNYAFRQVLQKLATLGCLVIWAFELGQFNK